MIRAGAITGAVDYAFKQNPKQPRQRTQTGTLLGARHALPAATHEPIQLRPNPVGLQLPIPCPIPNHTASTLSMSDQTPKIRIRGLYKRFGTKRVLDGVDLDVPRGTSLVIIGGSGSGKSVLLKCVLGLIEPDDGVIEIDGQDILRLPRNERELARSHIGMLFQAGALFDSLPVWENVAFGLLASHKTTRKTARAQAEKYLEQVGLAASVGDLTPAELSGGMQKRVALARAIASQPDIMFFDEPTTGLDPIMGAVIDGLIVDCVKRLGSTAIAITHDMASARRIGDQAAMLLDGRIIWNGPAAHLMDSGNAAVDQFTHGRREGPIHMALRR